MFADAEEAAAAAPEACGLMDELLLEIDLTGGPVLFADRADEHDLSIPLRNRPKSR